MMALRVDGCRIGARLAFLDIAEAYGSVIVGPCPPSAWQLPLLLMPRHQCTAREPTVHCPIVNPWPAHPSLDPALP